MNIFKNIRPKPNRFIPCMIGEKYGMFRGWIEGYEEIATPSGMPLTIKSVRGLVEFEDGTVDVFVPGSIRFERGE